MILVDSFLNEFCAIEKYLRSLTKSDEHKSLHMLLNEAKSKNRVISRYMTDLQSFGKLRNLLSHERYSGGHLATPSLQVVESIKELREKIMSQPKLFSLCSNDILSFDQSVSIQQVLLAMRKQDFSQVPISANGKLCGVLSSNTISRWLGSDMSEGLFCTSEVTIKEVMSHQEYIDNYIVLSKDETLGKAVAKFEKYSAQGKQLDAILVTHTGKYDQKLLGIITVADIPKIMSELY